MPLSVVRWCYRGGSECERDRLRSFNKVWHFRAEGDKPGAAPRRGLSFCVSRQRWSVFQLRRLIPRAH
ncbi:hypothetical protein JYU34_007376 [Plutella xylostella]|uniref:Uncharacterized protein n=1 Tax=Plutella xylostella TaxID=51655 RepID=A0ABQ7QQ98_PLUXY|nr:hypothetical protein JYU34_007376 [Plutella xylostella]